MREIFINLYITEILCHNLKLQLRVIKFIALN